MRELQLVAYTEMTTEEREAFGAQWRQEYAASYLVETGTKLDEEDLDDVYERYLNQEGYAGRDARIDMSRDRLYEKAKSLLGDSPDLRASDIVVDFDAGISVLVREKGVHHYIAPVDKPLERTFNVFDMKAYTATVRGWLAGDCRKPTKAVWTHDCDKCVFKGNFLSGRGPVDLYLCGDTVIGRYGNEPADNAATLASIALREGADYAHMGLLRNAMWLLQGRL